MSNYQGMPKRLPRHMAVSAIAVALLGSVASVAAQTSVEIVRRPYRETPALPLANPGDTGVGAQVKAAVTPKRGPAHVVAPAVSLPLAAAAAKTQDTAKTSQPTPAVAPLASVAAQDLKASQTQIAPDGQKTENVWDVTPADQTLRVTLLRWASREGWAFAPEYWTLERDLPVMASARFEGDFKAAVRQLLKSSEMTDLPVQPCFYSNKVLRVVGKSEVCSRQVATAAAPAL